MKKTLQKINDLCDQKIIERYAIGGGIAHFYYIEAGLTYDLDLLVIMDEKGKSLLSLEPIYDWAKANRYESVEEHIIIEGIPVQFLPAYNELIKEAVIESQQVELYGVKTNIVGAEYLMAIMLDVYRAKDKERLIKFFEECPYSSELFENLIKKFNLENRYKGFRQKYYG